jgi:hypothetical protein
MAVPKDAPAISDPTTPVSQSVAFCLLALGSKLCSQGWRHRVAGDYNHRAVDQMSFSRLMRHQLRQILDKNCEPLGKHGARGALFELQHKKRPHGKTALRKGDWTLVEGLLKIFGTSRTAIASANKPHNKKPPAQAPSNLSPSLAPRSLQPPSIAQEGEQNTIVKFPTGTRQVAFSSVSLFFVAEESPK